MEENSMKKVQYQEALRRVKKIKGFYIHLLVYIMVNTLIVFTNSNDDFFNGNKDFWIFETFSTALFWGIGLTAHGLSVFGRNLFFGENWEERKIKEFMEKEKNEKWE